jgi:hypothetical protein
MSDYRDSNTFTRRPDAAIQNMTNAGLVDVNDWGTPTDGHDYPHPFGLSPRWVPSEGVGGGYLSRLECHEQLEMELIVRRWSTSNARDRDVEILKPLLQNEPLPRSPVRGRELVEMEIVQQERCLRELGKQSDGKFGQGDTGGIERLNDLINELRGYSDRLRLRL